MDITIKIMLNISLPYALIIKYIPIVNAALIIIIYIIILLRRRKDIFAGLFHNDMFGMAAKAAALDEFPSKVVIINGAGLTVEVNKKVEKKFGYNDADMIGKEPYFLFSNGSKKVFAEHVEQFKDTLRLNVEFEAACITKSGDVFPAYVIMISKKLINREVFCLIGIRDITKDKEAIKNCEEKINLLDYGEEISNYGSWYWNLEADTVLMSAGFKRIFEVDKDICEANELMKFVHIEDRERVGKAIESCILEGKPYEVKYRKGSYNNQFINVIVKAAPQLNDAGKTVAIYGFIKTVDDGSE